MGLEDGAGIKDAFLGAVDGVVVWMVADERTRCNEKRHFETDWTL